MSHYLQFEEASAEEAPPPLAKRDWIAAALGVFPTAAAFGAVLIAQGDWVARLQIPSDYDWVRGVIAFGGLGLLFAVIAFVVELRRSRLQRLMDEMEYIDISMDRHLSEFSRSARRIGELSAMEAEGAGR